MFLFVSVVPELFFQLSFFTYQQVNEAGDVDVMTSDVDDDDDGGAGDSFAEYEWAGQTRVRVTSLTNGGLAAYGYQV